MELTAKQQAAVEALRLREARERRAHLACPCGDQMEYVVTLDHGDGEGRGSEHLYQCPGCKTIGVKDRL
jgi:hypothetical protein